MESYTSQLDFKEGSIAIQFAMDFDGNKVTIDNIQVHSNKGFDTNLPRNPTLEWHNNKWKLARHYQVNENNRLISRTEYLDSKWSNAVVDEIIRIKEAETPRFEK